MKNYILKFIFILSCITGNVATGSNCLCEAPEIIQGATKYNQFVCTGAKQLTNKLYNEAAASFEAAMEVPIFEVPNFELYPKLALAYFWSGEIEKANENLKKAEISLSLLTGVIHCGKSQFPTVLVGVDGKSMKDDISNLIAQRMCGVAYDYIYKKSSLAQIQKDAELVQRYLDIAEKIKTNEVRPQKISPRR